MIFLNVVDSSKINEFAGKLLKSFLKTNLTYKYFIHWVNVNIYFKREVILIWSVFALICTYFSTQYQKGKNIIDVPYAYRTLQLTVQYCFIYKIMKIAYTTLEISSNWGYILISNRISENDIFYWDIYVNRKH